MASLKDIADKYAKNSSRSYSGLKAIVDKRGKATDEGKIENNDSWTLDRESYLGSFINEGLAGLTGTYGGASRL